MNTNGIRTDESKNQHKGAKGRRLAGKKRASKHFVDINCGALPEQLVESELFGYQKGSFTGATETKRGLFEWAQRRLWEKRVRLERSNAVTFCAS